MSQALTADLLPVTKASKHDKKAAFCDRVFLEENHEFVTSNLNVNSNNDENADDNDNIPTESVLVVESTDGIHDDGEDDDADDCEADKT